MASYYIHMDQGIVADLRHNDLCSGQFSNCAPIVFYNADTHHGGLYHLGGCNALDEMKTNHLRVLESLVRPTVIYVLAGADENDPVFPARGHIGPVCAMFENHTVLRNFGGRSSYSSLTVKEINGALSIETGFSANNKLNKRSRINSLPDHIGFIGEKDDKALSLWL